MEQGPRGPQPAAIIDLNEKERGALEALANSRQSPHSLVIRAKIILLAANGWRNQQIARELKAHREMAHRWRTRWLEGKARLAAIEAEGEEAAWRQAIVTLLADAYRSGSPGKFSAEEICQIIAVACESPEESGRPISHWTPTELADEVVKRKIVASISPRQVGRFLKGERTQTPSITLLAQ